jgi:hypothetical protein
MSNLAIAEQRLRLHTLDPVERAVMTSFALGKAFLSNMDIMVHEMKMSQYKEIRVVGETMHKKRMKLHQDFHSMFKGATTHLEQWELDDFNEKVLTIISDMW